MFHVKRTPAKWWDLYWKLGRDITWQGITPNHIMRARILLDGVPRSGTESGSGSEDPRRAAAKQLEEVVAYGRAAFERELASRKAKARLGSGQGAPDDDLGRPGSVRDRG